MELVNQTEDTWRSSAYLLLLRLTKFYEGRKGPPRLSVLFLAQHDAPTRRAPRTSGGGAGGGCRGHGDFRATPAAVRRRPGAVRPRGRAAEDPSHPAGDRWST